MTSPTVAAAAVSAAFGKRDPARRRREQRH
jgi:hypothetical protein